MRSRGEPDFTIHTQSVKQTLNSIVSLSTSLLQTPLYSPFVTSQGVATAARAVVVRLELQSGIVGIGEAVPVQYVTGETIESVQAIAEEAAPLLIGLGVERYAAAFAKLRELAPASPSARCGIEMAVLDAWRQQFHTPLHLLWGGACRQIETDITIPIVPNVGELARQAWDLGIRIFKIKVGDSELSDDYRRVAAVREAAPDAKLRIDANQAFKREDALAFIERICDEGAHVQLLEQPVRHDDYDGLNWLAQRSPAPVFADESCRTPQDALKLVGETAVQGLNLKINKCGIAGVLEIIPIARAAGRRLMLGCMLETRRSIAISAALAIGTGAFEFIDLDSHLLLDEGGVNQDFYQAGAVMNFEAQETGA